MLEGRSRLRQDRDKSLNLVLNETLSAIERARDEMFFIAEEARQEHDEIRQELDRIKVEVSEQIRAVDNLQRQDRANRESLLKMSRDFEQFDEQEMRAAYDQAKEIQWRLQTALDRERHLRRARDGLERRLRRVERTLRRAEELVSQVGLAMDLMRGNLEEISNHVEGLRQRQALGFSIVRAQEEERRRLARDIHDGPAQLLANVAFRLDVSERVLDADRERVRKELTSLKEMVRKSLQDVRKIIFDLRPLALDDLGLVPALKAFGQEFRERTGVNCRVVANANEQRYPSALEIAAFRIVQEALNNVHKHSGAEDAVIEIEADDNTLKLMISDDGCGFEVSETLSGRKSGDHFGLLNIRERVELLQGELQIDSRPGAGTSVQVSLPVRERRGVASGPN